MKKENLKIILASIFSALLIMSSVAYAATPESSIDASKLTYPIADLGNCKDQSACATFCNNPTNMSACVAYAEKQGLLKGEDLRVSKIVAEKISKNETPGQCKTKAECENFCKGKVANMKECISFGEELGVIPADELAQAKNVMKALEGGAKMPGACTAKEDCEKYCSVGSHIDECLLFAEAANILSPEELKQAKAVAPFLKNGETPGKCQTKGECENYCNADGHFDECIGFAEKAGFVSKEEADIAKKVGGSGPGGCKSKTECENYCNIESNANECANFAVERGLVDEKTANLIKNGIDEMKKAMESLPPEIRAEVQSCLDSKIGADKVQRLLNKEISPTKNQGTSIESCFAGIQAKVQAMMKNGEGGGGPSGGAPSKEDIKRMIPDNVPQNIRDNIEKQMEQQSQGSSDVPPSGIPSGSSGGPVSAPTLGGQIPKIDCSAFSSVPSCSYVSGPAKDQCEKCKGE